jgi:hypothetical protein
MSGEPSQLGDAINTLVDQYRHRCLWFLRSDFYPLTLEQRLRVLAYIQRYGDRLAYRKAAEVRRWLSQSSNEESVG